MMRTALRLIRRSHGDDEGFSLMETLVASSIFGVFTTLVMLAIISMLNDTAKNQSLVDGQATIENVFQKLDHQVRYANGIQAPGTGVGANSTNYYVEWQAQPVSVQPATCTQLKFNPTLDTLQERTWQPKATVVSPTGWILLENNITNPAGVDPFFFISSGTSATNPQLGAIISHQQLQITLMSQPNGTKAKSSTASSSVATFTALNSTTTTGNVCQEVSRS